MNHRYDALHYFFGGNMRVIPCLPDVDEIPASVTQDHSIRSMQRRYYQVYFTEKEVLEIKDPNPTLVNEDY
jgi:hypothetical protein